MEAKKRGRKPKGGKLIETTGQTLKEIPVVQNIILHLKCSSKDIEKVVFNSTGVEPYTQEMCHAELNSYTEDTLHQKLKNISTRLHVNDINGRSDCFWCTCAFENPAHIYTQNHSSRTISSVWVILLSGMCCRVPLPAKIGPIHQIRTVSFVERLIWKCLLVYQADYSCTPSSLFAE